MEWCIYIIYVVYIICHIHLKIMCIYTIQFVSITRKHNGMIRICFRLPKLTKNWLQAARFQGQKQAPCMTVYEETRSPRDPIINGVMAPFKKKWPYKWVTGLK